MRIAIIGAENELHTLHMKGVLKKRGEEVLIIDTVAFPQDATLSLIDNKVKYQGNFIDDIKSFYARSVFYSHPPYDLEEVKEGKPINLDGWYSDYAAETERQSLLSSWIRSLSLQGKQVVNPIESFDLHYIKAYQLSLLRNNGIPVPETLVTNNPQAVIEFQEKFDKIIYKPVAGGAECKELLVRDLNKERLNLLHNAPVMFQEYIEGENIRVYIIDKEVVSAGIIYTKEIDYRGHEEGIEKIKLPDDIANMCIKAMHLCGMKFTGVDLKRKRDGEFVLLECNPSPMFIGFQMQIGDHIDERLADYLTS